MIEGIIAGVLFYLVCHVTYRLVKKWKKRKNTRSPKSSPAFSAPYGSEQTRRAVDILDDLVTATAELADSVSSRKRNSRSDDDDTWGGIDYD